MCNMQLYEKDPIIVNNVKCCDPEKTVFDCVSALIWSAQKLGSICRTTTKKASHIVENHNIIYGPAAVNGNKKYVKCLLTEKAFWHL